MSKAPNLAAKSYEARHALYECIVEKWIAENDRRNPVPSTSGVTFYDFTTELQKNMFTEEEIYQANHLF